VYFTYVQSVKTEYYTPLLTLTDMTLKTRITDTMTLVSIMILINPNLYVLVFFVFKVELVLMEDMEMEPGPCSVLVGYNL